MGKRAAISIRRAPAIFAICELAPHEHSDQRRPEKSSFGRPQAVNGPRGEWRIQSRRGEAAFELTGGDCPPKIPCEVASIRGPGYRLVQVLAGHPPNIGESQAALRNKAADTPPGYWVEGYKYDDTKLSDGRADNPASLKLPGRGQTAQFADEIFAGASLDLFHSEGSLAVRSPVAVSGLLAIRLSPGEFSALPVIPVGPR